MNERMCLCEQLLGGMSFRQGFRAFGQKTHSDRAVKSGLRKAMTFKIALTRCSSYSSRTIYPFACIYYNL